LTKPPTDDYKYVPCRLSKSINNVITTLCVHEITKDGWVSSSIWKYGVWEENIVTKVLNSLSKNPESLFLDIGAQVGEYSLYAAKLGCDVLTVEPFYDNVMRIHKVAFNESLGDKITLIKNAISNRRGEIKLLKREATNIGGQSLIENKNKNFTKDVMLNQNDINSKYFVETILFDDIVYNLPLKKDGREYTTALMKIDIESCEPYAFQYASKLFDTLKILVIYMEWGNYLYRAINHISL
jgi:FkbM family methyltransferase